jgi:hypothetical protein
MIWQKAFWLASNLTYIELEVNLAMIEKHNVLSSTTAKQNKNRYSPLTTPKYANSNLFLFSPFHVFVHRKVTLKLFCCYMHYKNSFDLQHFLV